jgi:hypothetical protein
MKRGLRETLINVKIVKKWLEKNNESQASFQNKVNKIKALHTKRVLRVIAPINQSFLRRVGGKNSPSKAAMSLA